MDIAWQHLASCIGGTGMSAGFLKRTLADFVRKHQKWVDMRAKNQLELLGMSSKEWINICLGANHPPDEIALWLVSFLYDKQISILGFGATRGNQTFASTLWKSGLVSFQDAPIKFFQVEGPTLMPVVGHEEVFET